jgi:hypothetical protein
VPAANAMNAAMLAMIRVIAQLWTITGASVAR